MTCIYTFRNIFIKISTAVFIMFAIDFTISPTSIIICPISTNCAAVVLLRLAVVVAVTSAVSVIATDCQK